MQTAKVKMLRDIPARGLKAGSVVSVRVPVAYTMCRRGDAEMVKEDPLALVAEPEPQPVPVATQEQSKPAHLPGPHTPLLSALTEHARQFAEESKPREQRDSERRDEQKNERGERHEKKRRR